MKGNKKLYMNFDLVDSLINVI